jgi:hypothetical protein
LTVKDPNEHLKELKAALAEAVQTIELAPVLGKDVVAKRLEQYKAIAATTAPFITEDNEKIPPLRVYVDQLEALARRVLARGGSDSEQAKLVLSPGNQKAIGLDITRRASGRVKFLDPKPSMKDRCPNTANGRHQTFQDGRRVYCRACGVEEMLKADGTLG